MLKDRVAELKAIRDQARADAERAEGAFERLGPSITPQVLKTFARQARRRMRTESGGYRRDHLRALAQCVEVDAKEIRIKGSKKRIASHPRRHLKRKNGGFWRAQFCTEVARPEGFEPPTPRLVRSVRNRPRMFPVSRVRLPCECRAIHTGCLANRRTRKDSNLRPPDS